MSVRCSFGLTDSPCQLLDCYGKNTVTEKFGGCRSNINEYLSKYRVSGGTNDDGGTITECDLILNRSGKFDISHDKRDELLICTYHRQYLSTHWPGCRRITCAYPEHRGKKTPLNQPRRVTQKLSEGIFSVKGYILPIGSGKPLNMIYPFSN